MSETVHAATKAAWTGDCASMLEVAIGPLVTAVGGSIVDIDEVEDGDITLEWDGTPAVGVRLAEAVSLDRLIEAVEEHFDAPLRRLDRQGRLSAVRLLDQRGAFNMRKSIDAIAHAMGVSRITVYNYLNEVRDQT